MREQRKRVAPISKDVLTRQKIILYVLDFAIATASVFLVVALFILGSSLREATRSYNSEDSFAYRIADGSYASLISMAYEWEAEDGKSTAEKRSCVAAGKYVEAVSYAEAFAAVGDTERAEKSEQAAAKAYAEMGELSRFAEEIRAVFAAGKKGK